MITKHTGRHQKDDPIAKPWTEERIREFKEKERRKLDMLKDLGNPALAPLRKDNKEE